MQPNVPRGGVPNPDVESFQRLADGAPVMIWMSGVDMGCFYFNRAWLDFRGRSLEQEYGDGWAQGVHPEDLHRCVQHYVSSFEKRSPFAMSYRLEHYSGEYKWILDRGVPHYDMEGRFLGFHGGCAETNSNSVSRLAELRWALLQMREFAERLAAEEANTGENIQAQTHPLIQAHRVRQHAVAQMGKLAVDMLAYDTIPNGVCLR